MKLINFFILLLSTLNIQNSFSAAVAGHPAAEAAAPPGVAAATAADTHHGSLIDRLPPKAVSIYKGQEEFPMQDGAVEAFNYIIADIFEKNDEKEFKELLNIFTDPTTNDLYPRIKDTLSQLILPHHFGDNEKAYNFNFLRILLGHVSTPKEYLKELIKHKKSLSRTPGFSAIAIKQLRPLEQLLRDYGEYEKEEKPSHKHHDITGKIIEGTGHTFPIGIPELIAEFAKSTTFHDWLVEHKKRSTIAS